MGVAHRIDKAVFTNNNGTTKFASGQECVTTERGVHSDTAPNTTTIFATDKKDTTWLTVNLIVWAAPYKVHPVITKLSYNTFEVDVKGDVNEPWSHYTGLVYQSKIYNEGNNLILTDTHRVFTFTAPAYQKYMVFTTYKTARPDVYTSVDTLFPDATTGIFSTPKNTISVYPNPAISVVILANLPTNATTITITDISGKMLAAQAVAISTELSITALPVGLYFIQVYDANNTLLGTAKLVKQ